MKRAITIVVAALLCASTLARAGTAPERPKLVIVLVVDQMRADYIERYGPLLSGGLARLRDEGLWCTNARHLHAVTSTAPGHATLATGCHPSHHGIISNTLKIGDKFPRAGADPAAKNITTGNNGFSSKDLLVSGLGDWLKAADARAHVVSIATKGRSAVMLGGKSPDLALYADDKVTQFTTSTVYAKAHPAWLDAWNQANPVTRWYGVPWVARLTDAQADQLGLSQDDAPWEGRRSFTTERERTFPHVAHEPDDLEFMPYGDERVLSLARAAIAALELGKDDATDLLAVSFSAADMIGHAYGTWSRELAEYYLWLDGALGALFTELDAGLKSGEIVLVLSADHGVSPIPEQLLAQGRSAGRIRIQKLKDTIDAALDARFGAADWVIDVLPDVYLDPKAVAASGASADAVGDEAARAAKTIEGIADAFTRARILAQDGGVPAPFRASYCDGRSGDVMLSMQPHWILDYLDTVPYVKANHSTQYDYDQRVPVMFLGGGLAHALVSAPVATIDVAPTLAKLVGAKPLNAVDGRALDLPRANGGER